MVGVTAAAAGRRSHQLQMVAVAAAAAGRRLHKLSGGRHGCGHMYPVRRGQTTVAAGDETPTPPRSEPPKRAFSAAISSGSIVDFAAIISSVIRSAGTSQQTSNSLPAGSPP